MTFDVDSIFSSMEFLKLLTTITISIQMFVSSNAEFVGDIFMIKYTIHLFLQSPFKSFYTVGVYFL